MASSWRSLVVADIAAEQRNALVGGPFGSNLVSRDYVEEGVPVIRGQNMGMGRWVTGPFVFVSTGKADELSANKARPGDLIFTQRGTLGQVALVPHGQFDEYIISQSQMKLTVNGSLADAGFLYYVFLSDEQQAYIRNNAVQTGVPHTNLGVLRETPLRLPPLDDQRRIASLLGCLDDRVEQMAHSNHTLEAICRAIFKSWFVDFDPVRAKAEGREPEGIDAATAALFPESLEPSGMGTIPIGWRIGSIAECVQFHNSRRVPLSGAEREQRQGPFPYFGAAGQIDAVNEYLFDGSFLLVGEDGSVIDKKGHPVIQHVWGRFWVNNHAHVLTPKDSWSITALRDVLMRIDIAPYVTGAVQPKLSMTNLKRVPVLIPPPSILQAYDLLTAPLLARERLNSEMSATLSDLRDTLLPRLISGKIRIAEAEELVEAAL